MTAREQLASFTLENIPDLTVVARGALELFRDEPITQTLPVYQKPLVVGSVGALIAGRMMYAGTNAIFADESTFEQLLNANPDIDGVILISASGSKHAVEIARTLSTRDVSVTLLTNNPGAPAKEFISDEQVIVLPKNREPYTNNTSTYIGMVLARTGEDVGGLLDFLDSTVASALTVDFARYDSFTFILPAEFGLVCQLIRVKFEEMFEPKAHGRAYTAEEIKHAKTVVTGKNELFIALGVENEYYGLPENRLSVPTPAGIGSAGMLGLSYFIVGHIQAALPPYFKENIAGYAATASEIFGKDINPIVE